MEIIQKYFKISSCLSILAENQAISTIPLIIFS